MKILILGSGNVATFFAHSWHQSKIEITQIFSRNQKHAAILAGDVSAEPISDVRKLNFIGIDAVVSALSDASAESMWQQMNFGQTPVFHTAGSLPLTALARYAVNCGVIYPLQSISKNRRGSLLKVPLLIEGNSETACNLAEILANLISKQVRFVDSKQREMIHLAAVFANNFSNAMFGIAGAILHDNGLSERDLLPLMDETAGKLHYLDSVSAQTGPAVRGDVNIMSKHLHLLDKYPDWQDIYRVVSREIGKRAGKCSK